MTVGGVKIEVHQAFESGEGIRQGLAHVDLDLSENLAEQREPSLALEALEECRAEDFSVVAVREILKKIPAALEQTQAAADARFKPKLVRQGGAVPAESGKIEQPAERLEKFDTDN